MSLTFIVLQHVVEKKKAQSQNKHVTQLLEHIGSLITVCLYV